MTDWHTRAALSRIEARQAVIIAMIRRVGRAVVDSESQLDQDLTDIETSMANESTAESAELADLKRELDDLVAAQNAGTITTEQHQRLQAVQARIDAITAAETQATSDIDTADPAPATPPVDGTPVQ